MPTQTSHTNNTLSFDPKELNQKLLAIMPKRAANILTLRFGLGKSPKKLTLESIGQKYHITRERVRQVEEYSLKFIRKSKEYENEASAYEELKKALKSFGGIVKENDFLEHISKDKSIQNHVHFMLVISHHFKKMKEDEEFHHRWHIEPELADKIHNALKKLYENLEDEKIVPESEIVKMFLEHIQDVSEEYKNEEIAKRWLTLSKKIGKNMLGDWGKASSSNIRTKGIKDYAYLVVRKHGSPLHFREVAKLIEETFKKKAHAATTHNELIKDKRFVLVGRGLYALTEWGYTPGIVRDVIKEVIEKEGPLPRKEVIEKVLEKRHVQPNTVLVNLQNPKFFRKDKEGRYSVV